MTPRQKAEYLLYKMDKNFYINSEQALKQVLVLTEEVEKILSNNWNKKTERDYEYWREVEREAREFCNAKKKEFTRNNTMEGEM